MQSLALGLQGLITNVGSVGDLGAAAGDLAPLIGQANVTIDGRQETMFALSLRETFPPGACVETLFVIPDFPPEPGVCTTPPNQVLLLLWQTHSATSRPDKLLMIGGDVGTTDFGFDFSDGSAELPIGGAIYMDGGDDVWFASDGTFTSAVSPTSESCAVPLPPYAKSGTCHIANFDEEASIVLESFSLQSTASRTMSVAIPRQTIRGILQEITEVQPVIFGAGAQRVLPTLWR